MLQVRKDIQEIHNKQEELNLNKKSILQKLEVASKMILRAKHAAPKVKAQHQSLGRTGSSALMSVPQLSAEDFLEIESMSTAPTLAGAVNSLNRISDHHENFLSAHEELMGKFDREMERAITDGEMTEAVDCYVERLAEHQKNLEGTRERLISLLEQTHRDRAALQSVWKLAPTDFLQGITSIKGSAHPLPCLRPNAPTADVADLSINLLAMSDAEALRIPSHLLLPELRISGFDKFHSQLESPILATEGSYLDSAARMKASVVRRRAAELVRRLMTRHFPDSLKFEHRTQQTIVGIGNYLRGKSVGTSWHQC